MVRTTARVLLATVLATTAFGAAATSASAAPARKVKAPLGTTWDRPALGTTWDGVKF